MRQDRGAEMLGETESTAIELATLSTPQARRTDLPWTRDTRPDGIIVVDLAKDGRLPDYSRGLNAAAYEISVCRSFNEVSRQDFDRAIATLVHAPANADAASERWVDQVIGVHDMAPHLRQILMVDDPGAHAGAVSALCDAGALYDFHRLPVDFPRLAHTVGHVRGLAHIERAYRSDVSRPRLHEPHMVGEGEAMRKAFNAIRRFAGADAPVLITGESGTGKELAARAIHERSPRAKGPFIAINCAALPATLIESELFGYERGAFTGAAQRKPGRLELADGGTLFLDEMGDLPPEVQAHFLRFLQEGTVDRLGGTRPIKVDARIVAATHVDLDAAVAEGRFREDLYYRLNVLRLELPALRERGDDIELLAHYFLNTFAAEHGRHRLRFSRNALIAIRHHAWPGNIRELISAVRRAVVMSDGPVVNEGDLGIRHGDGAHTLVLPTLAEARNAAERDLLLRALKLNKNNVQKASRELEISRVSFYRLLKKHRIDY